MTGRGEIKFLLTEFKIWEKELILNSNWSRPKWTITFYVFSLSLILWLSHRHNKLEYFVNPDCIFINISITIRSLRIFQLWILNLVALRKIFMLLKTSFKWTMSTDGINFHCEVKLFFNFPAINKKNALIRCPAGRLFTKKNIKSKFSFWK